MFVILQKYDFSSKSQQKCSVWLLYQDVCDTAKVRFFKQITTVINTLLYFLLMFVILQKYDFSSKSQQLRGVVAVLRWCLWYCKSTIFQANHNRTDKDIFGFPDVCDTAKVRFFKQITTAGGGGNTLNMMFVILQKYDFSSKSQHAKEPGILMCRCLWYCKSTIFQANHNTFSLKAQLSVDVCDTAKVRFFKQITTR